MGEEKKVPNYQVKVDNWSIFFLQRLYHFYRKDHHCDLTLVFSSLNTVKCIKVHRLVLHACTDYFESLEVTKDSELGEYLQLSNEMHPDVIIPIISFMYTGKLEFPASLQSRLYEAATKLRMTILTKLLDAQPKQLIETTVVTQAEDSLSKSTGLPCSTSDINNVDGGQNSNSYLPDVQIMQIVPTTPIASPGKQIEDPIVTLTPIAGAISQQKPSTKSEAAIVSRAGTGDAPKTSNTIFKTKAFRKETSYPSVGSTPKTKIVDVSLPPTLPGRKLPIWKRKVPFTGYQRISESTTEIRGTDRVSTETSKPTRFEWDEDLSDPTALRPVEDAFRILAHDGATEIQHPIILDKDVKEMLQKEDNNASFASGKRNSPGSPNGPDSPPYKKSRQADLQDMKEYGRQQQLRNEILCNEENSEDGMDTDDLYGSCDEESQDVSSSSQSVLNASTPKPILKSLSKPEPSQPASKRVRFSLEGKENNKKSNDFTASVVKNPGAVLTKQKIILPMNVKQIRTKGHHVKIVSEVLKKYPNLTRRDNVKLKVVSKIPAAVPPTVQYAVEGDAGSGNKSITPHVSYIYLMNENPNQVFNAQTVSNDKEKEFDVENRTGPWICNSCDPSHPIEFDSYYNYRRHLVEIHELKIDARICEYCGVRSSKRNHLLYHLYTKHGIDPPAHVSFPKCSDCDYIALSDALLIKHRSLHETKELLTCYVCNVVFKTLSSLQIHLQSTWHKKKMLDVPMTVSYYPCPFCEIQFSNGHLNSNYHAQQGYKHANCKGKQIYRCPYCEELFVDGDKLGKHIVSTHWGKSNQSSNQGANEGVLKQSGQELQYNVESMDSNQLDSSNSGENHASSDLESLNNVASGIVTSLNLSNNEQTVVYYEPQTGHQDIGREATVMTGEECKDFIIPGTVEEIGSSEFQRAEQVEDAISIDNEDSNSRTSAVEEVHPTSCSDHDYSEPQTDDNVKQVIPVQQVSDGYQAPPIIQQILPEQQLVFTSQPNVVFQSSRINMPQRVILAPGDVVLSQIAHSGQNVILPQVIPQTRIILSNQIIQQPTNIIPESGNTIVFTNSEVSTQDMENVESISYENVENSSDVKVVREKSVIAQGNGDCNVIEERNEEENVHEEVRCNDDEESLSLNEFVEESNVKDDNKTASILSNRPKQKSVDIRGETAKIVDDWDETNESSQNVETRSDGPSRPDFF